MKVYNVCGYSVIALHIVAAGLAAPQGWSFLEASAAGFIYLVFIWFSAGVYLSDVIHMGIAHGTLDYKPGFIKFITIFNNAFAIYINPITWVNRHRHHHTFSDHDGDPNKLDEDGFWKTLYLCVFPYKCKSDLARDDIFRTRTFRFVSNRFVMILFQLSSFGLLWFFVRDWLYALVLWCGVRIFALWVNMIQNYWTHNRNFGTRNYQDEHDNAMNLSEWLPVTATFSACLQNNHHHYPAFLRTSHLPEEYDFGFMTVRAMRALGLVQASETGSEIPQGVRLDETGF